MRTILYARVSTTDQTSAQQLAPAEAARFEIDEVVAGDGVSGFTTKLADRAGCNHDDAIASLRRPLDMGATAQALAEMTKTASKAGMAPALGVAA